MTAVTQDAVKSNVETDAIPRLQLSLRWKLFISLCVLLGLVLVLMGRLSWLSLNNLHSRHADQLFRFNASTINAVVDQNAAELAGIAAQLLSAATFASEEGEQADPLQVAPDLFARLNWIRLFDGQSNAIGEWSLIGSTGDMSSSLIRELVSSAAGKLQPLSIVNCAQDCEHVVVVPAYDASGNKLIVMLAAPFYDLLPDFAQATGIDVAYFVADENAQMNLLAVSNAPEVRPVTLAFLAQQHLAGLQDAQRFRWQGGDYAFAPAELIRTRTEGQEFVLLLIRDETQALQEIRKSTKTYLLSLGSGMLVVSIAVFLLLARSLRRLTRITSVLPSIAEQKFKGAQEYLSSSQRTVSRYDEVDVLRAGLEWLVLRLERLHGAEAASEAKSRFLATMSHEIRTPLSGILGLIEMLETSSLSSDQQRTARMIHESANSLMTIISDVLDYSRVEAGSQQVESIPFSVQELVEGVAETIGGGAFRKGLRTVVLADPEIPTKVVGDPAKTRQILLNLVSNALKFTESGRVLIRAELTTRTDGILWLRYSVADTGMGIPEQARERLFQRFSQADASTTRRFGGSGLGLAICKGLTELLGGHIAFESIDGVGSRFWFELPYQASESSSDETPPALAGVEMRILGDDKDEVGGWRRYCVAAGAQVLGAGDSPSASAQCIELLAEHGQQFSGARVLIYDEQHNVCGSLSVGRPVRAQELIDAVAKAQQAMRDGAELSSSAKSQEQSSGAQFTGRVLVVEDHPINLELVGKQLRHLGCMVIETSSGAEALRQLERQEVDLVISDLHMPEMDGYRLTRRIRDHRKASIRKLPIVILTASAGPADEAKLRQHRVNDKLVKPASLTSLAQCLEKYLGSNHGKTDQAAEAASSPVVSAPVIDTGVASDSAVPVDYDVIREVIGDDQELFAHIVAEFFRVNDPLHEELMECIRQGDTEQIRSKAHRLKGSVSTLGAHDLVEQLQALESEPAAADLGAMAETTRQEYQRLRDYLAATVTTEQQG